MAKILVVDDSDVLRSELSQALRTAGHEVVEAIDGEDGGAKAAAQADFNLVITDLNMPRCDGIAMCRRIRELGAYRKLPIFMLTTESAPELKLAGREVGVLVWIIKPFVAAKVNELVDKIMAKAKAS